MGLKSLCDGTLKPMTSLQAGAAGRQHYEHEHGERAQAVQSASGHTAREAKLRGRQVPQGPGNSALSY